MTFLDNDHEHVFPKSVYSMKLNEEMFAEPAKIKFDDGEEIEAVPLRILRVPGGWIYYNVGITRGGVFVPFDNQFQKEAI